MHEFHVSTKTFKKAKSTTAIEAMIWYTDLILPLDAWSPEFE